MDKKKVVQHITVVEFLVTLEAWPIEMIRVASFVDSTNDIPVFK